MKSIVLVGFFMVCAVVYSQPIQSTTMYVERNEFQLKFGASKEALPMWRGYLDKVKARDKSIHARLLTDVSGPAYTMVLEIYYSSFAEAEPSQCRLTHQTDWKEFYDRFIPLCERSSRTYYKLQTEM